MMKMCLEALLSSVVRINLQIILHRVSMTVLLFIASCDWETVYNYFIPFCATVKTITPRGAVDNPMNCCPRPKAEGNSSSGHPQHRGGDNLTVAQKGMK